MKTCRSSTIICQLFAYWFVLVQNIKIKKNSWSCLARSNVSVFYLKLFVKTVEGTIIAVLEVVAFVVIQDTLFVMCNIRDQY